MSSEEKLDKIINIIEKDIYVNETEARIFLEFRKQRRICNGDWSNFGGVKPESLISSVMGIIDNLLEENEKLRNLTSAKHFTD